MFVFVPLTNYSTSSSSSSPCRRPLSIGRSIVVRRRKCLVYTHTIRFINHAMVTRPVAEKGGRKEKKKKEKNPSIQSSQSEKIACTRRQSTNPFFVCLSSLLRVRCTCSARTEGAREREKSSENLSCHRRQREREKRKKDSLTEEASNGTAANLNFICIKN